MKYGVTSNFINGRELSNNLDKVDVYSPWTGELISKLVVSSDDEVREAILIAKKAQNDWSNLTVKARSQVLYKYRELLILNKEDLAQTIYDENGKSIEEARQEVEKAIELTEFACSIPQIVSGEIQEVSRGVFCYSNRRPLGVVGVITPFNFPLMVPSWSIPNAIVLGNAVITKPSEKTPITLLKMAKIFKEAGLPDGIFNIVNGSRNVVNELCSNKNIEAISFVGSTPVAEYIYKLASSNLKRVLALGGAKNHIILVEDANEDMAVNDIISSFTGMSGQRCMAASVLITLGNVEHIIKKIIDKVKNMVPGVDLPTIITKESIENIKNFIEKAESLGAKILVNGFENRGDNKGYKLGPTIVDYRETKNEIIESEVFGPTLEIVKASSLKEAIEIQNKSNYGNAASIFTQNGRFASDAIKGFSAGMLGVNIGVPVPREPFSFGGTNESKFGALDITGKQSIDFWTKLIKITTKWNPEDKKDWMS